VPSGHARCPCPMSSTLPGLLAAARRLESRFHRLGQRVRAGHWADHDEQLVDQTGIVEAEEVTSLDLYVSRACLEDERQVSSVRRADLQDVTRVAQRQHHVLDLHGCRQRCSD